MAYKTPNLQLEVYNPAESNQVFVRDWISFMSNMNGSNMTILDTTVGKILQFMTPSRLQIVGDGTTNTFAVFHTHNNLTPIVTVFNQSGVQMFPEVSVINNGHFKLIYKFPLALNVIHNVIYI